MPPDTSETRDEVKIIPNDQLTIEHLPSWDAGIDELCRFAASFAGQDGHPARENTEPALTVLRSHLHGLQRRLYRSNHEGPEDYRPQMQSRVEHIRHVLNERTNAHPACERAREFFKLNNNPSLLPCWTSVDAADEDVFVVEVFFIIQNLSNSSVHSRVLRLSRDLSSIKEVPAIL